MTDTILIWGAGAIGGTLGAYLARAGEDVLLVDIVERACGGHEPRRPRHRGPGRGVHGQNVRAVAPTSVHGRVQAHHPGREGAPHPRRRARAEAASRAGRLRAVGAERPERIDHRRGGRRASAPSAASSISAPTGSSPGEILFGNRAAVAVGEIDGDEPATHARDYHRAAVDLRARTRC